MSKMEARGLSAARRLDEVVVRLVGGPAKAVSRAFDLMGIAEREIALAVAAAGGKKEKGNRIWDAFALLRPGALSDYGDELYRAHCRELLARCEAGLDTQLGTAAEACAVLSESSLKAPLDSAHMRAYEDVFQACFGKLPPGTRRSRYEGYPGEVSGIVGRLRSKLSQPWRVVA